VQLAPAKAIEGIASIAEITPAHIDEIKRAFDAAALSVTVLGCYIEPAEPIKEKRLSNVKTFCDNLAYGAQLGVTCVGTETTRLAFDATEAEREERYALVKDSVLRMVEAAEKTGVTIGIEPVADHTINTPALTRRLLDEVKSDKLKLIFDPANLLLPHTVDRQQEIFNEMCRLNGDNVAVMHIKNIAVTDGAKSWCNLGRGVIEYAPLFAWLNGEKPFIPLLLDEVRPPSHGEDLARLRQLAGM